MELSMDHVNVQELWRSIVRLSQQQRRSDGKFRGEGSPRRPLTAQSEVADGVRSFVPCRNEVRQAVALILLYLLHSAHGSTASCVELRREHTIHVGSQRFICHRDELAPQIGGGANESYWSCVGLQASAPGQPFLLQSSFHHGKSHASTGRDSASSPSSLREFQGEVSEDMRARKLQPIADRQYSSLEWSEKAVPDQWMVADIATTCCNVSSSSAAGFETSGLVWDPRNSPREAVCSPWRCTSTITARSTRTRTHAEAALSSTRPSAGSVTASMHLSASFSAARWTRSSLLLRVLEEVDERLRSISYDGDGDGPPSLGGRTMTGRRTLLARSWKPVIVADSVVVVVGFTLALLALSCWVRQKRAVKSDADIAVPQIHPSTPSSPVMTGPGTWDWAPAEGRDEDRPASGLQVAESAPGVAEGGPRRGAAMGSDRSGSMCLRSHQAAGEPPPATAIYRVEPFGLRALVAATADFDNSQILGGGSFGSVYRGLLSDGRVVAVKRADRDSGRRPKMVDKRCAFKAELDVMSRLHHKHLVNLVGYCDDCDEMMLVYEYMPNGTLADHLHHKRFNSRALSAWTVRIRMALEAARGIEYLHTYAEPPVIHRDIKSSNLMLDAEGSVRLSDFGLCFVFPPAASAKDEEQKLQLVGSKAAGTMGYMDPEYYRRRNLTTKSDVYSFGVVVLELLTGKRAIHRHNNSHTSVVDYALPATEAGELASILDPRLPVPTGHAFAALKVMAEVGSQAVRMQGKDRPAMTEIVRRLEQAVALSQARHDPLGAQIGSASRSSSPGSRSSDCSSGGRPAAGFHLDPAAAAQLDKFAGTEEDEDYSSMVDGADVAQLPRSMTTSQAPDVEDTMFGDSCDNILTAARDDDGSFGQDRSDDVNLEIYQSYAQDDLPSWSSARALREALGWPSERASAAGSSQTMETESSCSSDAAPAEAPAYDNHGGQASGPEHAPTRRGETLLGDCWWRARLNERVEAARSECSSSADDWDLPEEVHLPPPPKPSRPTKSRPVAVAGTDRGGESEASAESHVVDIDIDSFGEECSGERAFSASYSYAGFSNFSVLHDLDDLMRALHCLKDETAAPPTQAQ